MIKVTKRISTQGVSLVELIVGSAILIIVFAGGFFILSQLTRHTVSQGNLDHVERALDVAMDKVRKIASGEFDEFPNQRFANMFQASSRTVTGGSPVDLDVWDNVVIDRLVAPLIQNTRTRVVTLTATWHENGKLNTRVRTYSLNETKLRIKGGNIRFTFKDTDGNPVDGIRVSGPNHDKRGSVYCVSGKADSADTYYAPSWAGACVLTGLLVNSGGVDVTMDGEGSISGAKKYYFAQNEPSPTATSYAPVTGIQNKWNVGTLLPEFYRVIHTEETEQDKTISAPTFTVRPLGKIKGRIRNSEWYPTSSDPQYVPGQAVRLMYTDRIINRGEPFITSVDTPADGSYEISELIPGKYYVSVLGKNGWASLGLQADGVKKIQFSDLSPLLQPFYNNDLDSGEVLTVNLDIIKRGSLSGDVRGVNRFFAATSNAATNLGLIFNRKNSEVRHNSAPLNAFGFPIISMALSLGWHYLNNPTHPTFTAALTNGSGRYQTEPFTPAITDRRTGTYPLDEQYNQVQYQVTNLAPSPFTPVMVKNPGAANPNMQLYIPGVSNFFGYAINPVLMDATAGLVNPPTDFYIDLRAGRNEELDIHLLEREAFANIYGEILYCYPDASIPPNDICVPFNGENVTNVIAQTIQLGEFGTEAFGALILDMGSKASMSYSYSRSLPFPSSGRNMYSISPCVTVDGAGNANTSSCNNSNPFILPPTIGGATTTIKARATYSNFSSAGLNLVVVFEPWMKHQAPHAPLYDRAPVAAGLTGFLATLMGATGNGYTTTYSIASPNPSNPEEALASSLVQYVANKQTIATLNAPVPLSPGQNLGNLDPNGVYSTVLKMRDSSESYDMIDYSIAMDLNSLEWYPHAPEYQVRRIYNNSTPHPIDPINNPDYLLAKVKLWKRQHIHRVYGVITAKGSVAEALGATVTLQVSGGPSGSGYTTVTPAVIADVDICDDFWMDPNCPVDGNLYQYYFTDQYFIGRDVRNMKITVSQPGYITQNILVDGYDEFDERIDIDLVPGNSAPIEIPYDL